MLKKSAIRIKLLSKLNTQKEAIRLKKSRKIKRSLFSLLEIKQAKTVMFYIAKNHEVETHEMIRAALRMGKKVVVPVTDKKNKKIIASQLRNPARELEIGPFGIMQPKKENIKPVSLDIIDVIVVPGVGFDKNCNRLGRGNGYFDKFLAQLGKHTVKIGIAFDFQLLDKIPAYRHDIPVNKIITA